MSAEVAHQLTIFVANKPGVLGKVCELLRKEKVNIYAITTSDNRDHSVIRLVVDEPHRALGRWRITARSMQETDVIMIDGPNKPGTIAEMARKLRRGQRQQSTISTAPPRPRRRPGLLIFKPSNVAKDAQDFESTGRVDSGGPDHSLSGARSSSGATGCSAC